MKINHLFNVKSQKRCLQAALGIGVVSSIAGVFLAAAGEPSAIAALVAGPSSLLFAQKNLNKFEKS